MCRNRSLIGPVVLSALFGALIALAGWLGAQQALAQPKSPPGSQPLATPTPTCIYWMPVASPNVEGGGDHELRAIGANGPNDVWAVGFNGRYDVGFGCCSQTLVQRWDGTRWSIVPSPNRADNRLYSVAAISANDVWAVGYSSEGTFGSSYPLIMRWNGSEWTIVPSPDTGMRRNILASVAAVSANDV